MDASASFEVFAQSKKSGRVGSSVGIINGNIVLMGGYDTYDMSTYLHVSIVSPLEAKYIPEIICTDGIINRWYHACADMKDSSYIFGGQITNGTSSNPIIATNEIIKCEHTIFGFKFSVAHNEDSVKKVGLTANTVGEDKDRVIIFGGNDPTSNTYSNSLLLFHEGSDGQKYQLVEVEAEPDNSSSNSSNSGSSGGGSGADGRPSPRAFHCSCVCGERNQFLLVYGGISEHNVLLDDLWLLDMTELLVKADPEEAAARAAAAEAEEASAKTAKGAKPAKKDQSVNNIRKSMASWHRIRIGRGEEGEYLSSGKARYLASGFVCFEQRQSAGSSKKMPISSTSETRLTLFGGISETGPSPMHILSTVRLCRKETNGPLYAPTGFNHLDTAVKEGAILSPGQPYSSHCSIYGFKSIIYNTFKKP
jgi:hypothetical protein